MIIYDRVYGKIEIKEKVLIDLINSKPLQRLKRIKQAGISGYVIPYKKNITRFEHSVGVMNLLKIFGANLKEQIAGLLHDVSHTAFSHLADFVFANEHHEFHELHYADTILKTDIASILKRHDYDPHDFLSHKEFRLLEKNIPDLCADRIDYFLRDRNARLKRRGDKEHFLNNLIIKQNSFVFKNKDAALKFAKEFLYQNKVSWYAPEDVFCHTIMAEIIKRAIRLSIISKTDLFTDDETVYKKLKKIQDKQIKNNLKFLSQPFLLDFRKDSKSIFLKSKPRYVDPLVLINGVERLSKINKNFKKHLETEIEWMKKGFWAKASLQ